MHTYRYEHQDFREHGSNEHGLQFDDAALYTPGTFRISMDRIRLVSLGLVSSTVPAAMTVSSFEDSFCFILSALIVGVLTDREVQANTGAGLFSFCRQRSRYPRCDPGPHKEFGKPSSCRGIRYLKGRGAALFSRHSDPRYAWLRQ